MKMSGTIFNRPRKKDKQAGEKGGKALWMSKDKFIEQQKRGKEKAIEDLETERQKNEKQLSDISEKSNHILCRAKAVFPFDFFPDEITVDSNQVNVVQRNFFWSATMLSVPIKNIADTLVEVALFFGTLKIIDQAFKSDPITIKFLKKSDAMQIRRTIQGLVVANTGNVKVSRLQTKQLTADLPTLGAAAGLEYSI